MKTILVLALLIAVNAQAQQYRGTGPIGPFNNTGRFQVLITSHRDDGSYGVVKGDTYYIQLNNLNPGPLPAPTVSSQAFPSLTWTMSQTSTAYQEWTSSPLPASGGPVDTVTFTYGTGVQVSVNGIWFEEIGGGPFGSALAPNGVLVDAQGNTWTFGTDPIGNYTVLINGVSAAGGQGTLLFLTFNGVVQVMDNANDIWYWNGTGWVYQGNQLFEYPFPKVSYLTAPASGYLVDTSGNQWSFGQKYSSTRYAILENQIQAGAGAGMTLVNVSGVIYDYAPGAGWFFWDGTTWQSSAQP